MIGNSDNDHIASITFAWVSDGKKYLKTFENPTAVELEEWHSSLPDAVIKITRIRKVIL